MKCKLRVCCSVKNAPLPRTSYCLRKGQKNISESSKTFLQGVCDYSSVGLSLKEFRSSQVEGLKPDTLRSGEGSLVHCPGVREVRVTSPCLHHEMKPGKRNSHLLIISHAG